jgi:uncharacterized protein (DUF488 family)
MYGYSFFYEKKAPGALKNAIWYQFYRVTLKIDGMNNMEIWTIGHSTHTIAGLLQMLKAHRIEVVADIRRFPGSRRLPQFNKDELSQSLNSNLIQYFHFEALGGRRSPKKDSKNTGWRVAAFRGYADYMQSETFREEVEKLESMASAQRLAYMCSEAVWWSCHRALLSDYLKHRGWSVWHIMSAAKTELHPWTKPARIKDGNLVYLPDNPPLF